MILEARDNRSTVCPIHFCLLVLNIFPECAQGVQGVKGILTELLPFTVQLGQMMGP
jgi:hypothetical protein